jgi:hypothetical protein
MAGNTQRDQVCPNCGRFAVRCEEDCMEDGVLDIFLAIIIYQCLCCGYTSEQDKGNNSNPTINKRRQP